MSSGPIYTPSMLASALKHYEERDTWTRLHVRTAGRPTTVVVIFESSKRDAEGRPLVHRTTELWCSCDGFQYHRQMCSHLLAVRMEAEQVRRQMTRRPRQHERTDITSAF